jgi:hypothetical protein
MFVSRKGNRGTFALALHRQEAIVAYSLAREADGTAKARVTNIIYIF